MDEIDIGILKELSKDFQTPFLRIAKKLGVSTGTIVRRYQRMMMKQHQIGTTILEIDISKFGYQAVVFLFIKIAPNCVVSEIVDIMKEIPNIFNYAKITGEFNIFANAAVKNLEDFTALITEIRGKTIVERVEFILVDETFFPSPYIDSKLFWNFLDSIIQPG